MGDVTAIEDELNIEEVIINEKLFCNTCTHKNYEESSFLKETFLYPKSIIDIKGMFYNGIIQLG